MHNITHIRRKRCTQTTATCLFIYRLLFFKGEFLASRRRYKEAAMMYEKAAELRPDDYELAIAAATAMRQAARYDDAERWYRKAVTLKPTVRKIFLTKIPLNIWRQCVA